MFFMLAPIFSILIVLLTFSLLVIGKFHRLIVVMAGALAMLIGGRILGFYTEVQAFESVDFHTLGLLLGLMILLNLAAHTGLLQVTAVWLVRAARGKPIRLLMTLSGAATLVSLYIDNVTVILFIVPVTIILAHMLELNPTPYIIAEVILANIGSTATLVGNPPNILVASAAQIPSGDFISQAFPLVFIVWGIALILIRRMFRQQSILRLDRLESSGKLNSASYWVDREQGIHLLIVLGGALVLFLRQDFLGVSPAVIAIGAAVVALVWIRPNIYGLMKSIHWEVMGFLTALFVLTGGLIAAGTFQNILDFLSRNQRLSPVLLGILFLWIVALFSAIVDNLPATLAFIPIIQNLGSDGFTTTPLWWALVLGTGLGSVGTMIGSTSNVLAVSLSQKMAFPISQKTWLRWGLPALLVSCTTASLLYFLAFPWLTR
jgi:Na+/H+ antiporter NhaD/arsenite permease-like protein